MKDYLLGLLDGSHTLSHEGIGLVIQELDALRKVVEAAEELDEILQSYESREEIDSFTGQPLRDALTALKEKI